MMGGLSGNGQPGYNQLNPNGILNANRRSPMHMMPSHLSAGEVSGDMLSMQSQSLNMSSISRDNSYYNDKKRNDILMLYEDINKVK